MVKTNDLEAFFKTIADEKYLVMRNFDNMLSDVNDGGDIDILVQNMNDFVKKINAKPLNTKVPCFNYVACIGTHNVPLDIRTVGDGYYDAKWEMEMLAKRERKELYFVMDTINYMYSILYHCLIHKKCISDKYRGMLCDYFGDRMSETELLTTLSRYMKQNEYRCLRPDDKNVFFNKKNYKRLKIRRIIDDFRKNSC